MQKFPRAMMWLPLFASLAWPVKGNAVTGGDMIYVCGMTIALVVAGYGEDKYVAPIPLLRAGKNLRGIRWVKDRLTGISTGSKFSRFGKIDITVGRQRVDRLESDGRMFSTYGKLGVRSLIVVIQPETEVDFDHLKDVIADLQDRIPLLEAAYSPSRATLVLHQLSLLPSEPAIIFDRLFAGNVDFTTR